MVKIVLNNFIYLHAPDLPTEVVQDIQRNLTIPNREKIMARQQHLWGAEKLPDLMTLYKWSGEWLILPRGFYKRLSDGLRSLGYEIDLDNQMTNDIVPFIKARHVAERPYQLEAIADMEYFAQGIYEAPTGSGKTVTMLSLVYYLQRKTLVIVNKKELVQQWIERSKEVLGYEPGFIGDGRWEEKELTIAMQQTLWARRDTVDDFWSKWGMVILDECHSVQAETYHEIIEKFAAQFRFGVSATPRKTGHFKIAESVLGPVIHKTAKQPLRDAGYLVTPRAFIVPTHFYHPFEEDQISKAGRVTKRNNYHEVLDRLVKNSERNKLIVTQADSLRERCILVLTKRLAHIELLKEEFQSQGHNVLLLTGQETLEQRMEVYEIAASSGNLIILSTLADEGVDIPRIDTIFAVFPSKNLDAFRQEIGRGERPHPKKKDFRIYDFVDFSIPPIKKQYYERKRQLYRAEGIEVARIGSEKLDED